MVGNKTYSQVYKANPHFHTYFHLLLPRNSLQSFLEVWSAAREKTDSHTVECFICPPHPITMYTPSAPELPADVYEVISVRFFSQSMFNEIQVLQEVNVLLGRKKKKVPLSNSWEFEVEWNEVCFFSIILLLVFSNAQFMWPWNHHSAGFRIPMSRLTIHFWQVVILFPIAINIKKVLRILFFWYFWKTLQNTEYNHNNVELAI